ncbi:MULTISPECIES: ATP-binding protein [Sphingobacterium]|uniref:ATP-binding protein n=1 Tax=Sphingobacterium TaxID=28453 RepID=UPI0013DB256F|nr:MULTISPECIES: ATP-binding protein [unclassified Sphingobacterium]
MKKIFLALGLAGFIFTAQAQTHKLEKLWEADQGLPVPESVLYDAAKGLLYVSLIDGSGTEKDGKGGVALLNPDGSLKNANWITGLNAPKGLALYRGLLHIADINSVIVADVVTNNIIDEVEIKGSTFLNDVTVDDNGVVYVSDTRDNKIYQIRNGNASLYMENVPSVNGLKYLNGSLYALAGAELWKIDTNKKVQVIAKGFEKGGDGLEPVGNGDFLVTCWPGLIYYVKADGSIEKLQDVQGKMNTADLGFNAKERILYIPTFNNNSVIAYQLK